MLCSFGVMGPTKLNHRLLEAWLASDLAGDPRCHLVFAGEDPAGRYASRMRGRMAGTEGVSRVRVTGFIAAELYRHYLAAADVAVQLRSLSRGETSRAVLDCMAHALPTIINAHGALAELPRECLVVLPEEFTDGDLVSAIAAIRADARLGTRLGARARDYVRVHHSPRLAAARYRAAIEELSLHGREAVQTRAVAALAGLEARPPGKPEWLAAARALHHDIPPANPGRALFVDVSELIRRDVGSGIQRVVHRVLGELMARPPPGYRVEPVYATEESRGYFYARAFTTRFLGCTGYSLRDAPLDCRQGDIFLGLDLQPHVVRSQGGTYDAMRRAGVGLYFVVHDLLPLSMPRFFARGAAEVHARWLSTIARIADGLICVSRSVADEVIAWLDAGPVPRARALRVGWVHHGADIRPARDDEATPRRSRGLPDSIGVRPGFLMVGTIEPRKGHEQALAAFEKLWARGVDVGLVIVGRQGWVVEKFVRRLGAHPERGRRLVWLEHADDEALEALYARSSCLLAASEGEGFGLPLIEAARHGLSILARDLPVFREVAGRHARYFRAATAEDLAGAIEGWLASFAAGTHERSTGMPWLSWAESAERLKELLLGDGWYASWPAAAPPAPPPAPDAAAHCVEDELTGLNSEARS